MNFSCLRCLGGIVVLAVAVAGLTVASPFAQSGSPSSQGSGQPAQPAGRAAVTPADYGRWESLGWPSFRTTGDGWRCQSRGSTAPPDSSCIRLANLCVAALRNQADPPGPSTRPAKAAHRPSRPTVPGLHTGQACRKRNARDSWRRRSRSVTGWGCCDSTRRTPSPSPSSCRTSRVGPSHRPRHTWPCSATCPRAPSGRAPTCSFGIWRPER